MLHVVGASRPCFLSSTTCRFFGPPGAVQPAFGQNQASHRFVGALRTGVRPVAARPQARQTERGAALQMFIAGLAADPELLAQIRDAKASALRDDYEPIDLFHRC